MIIDTSPPTLAYTASTGDWRLIIEPRGPGDLHLRIEPIATGGLEYSSGANLDHLADLIVAARDDATARGIDWSGN